MIVLAQARSRSRGFRPMRRKAQGGARDTNAPELGILNRLEKSARTGLLPFQYFRHARNRDERDRAALAFAVQPRAVVLEEELLDHPQQLVVVHHPLSRAGKPRVASQRR